MVYKQNTHKNNSAVCTSLYLYFNTYLLTKTHRTEVFAIHCAFIYCSLRFKTRYQAVLSD